MIIEFVDIVNDKKAFGHSQGLPDGANLGMIFQPHPQLKDVPDLSPLLPSIIQVSINGRVVSNWQSIRPGPHDRVNFVISPSVEVLGIIATVLSIISSVISIVQFIISLFSSPQTAKQARGPRESDTYAFEGIRDTFQLGAPIPVTYGEHRKGGQVLMYYLTPMPENKGTRLHMLLSLGEGPCESVSRIELNNQPISHFDSVTTLVKLGTSSQAFMPGFETIKNTFHDGREITDGQKNGVHNKTTKPGCSQTFYRTTAYDCVAAEYYVAGLQGIFKVGVGGNYRDSWSRYAVEYRASDVSSYSDVDAPWTLWDTRQLGGKWPIPTWDFAQIIFPKASQWDLRFTWRAAKYTQPTARVQYKIWLQDVTEIRGPSGTFSSEVLLALDACPTAQLHGGQPNVTAILKGRQIDVYTSINSYVNQWSNNPAWPMVDWMTNSRYSMGADIQTDKIDLQSFLDFATLAESLAETCGGSAGGGCPTFGTPEFYAGDPFEFSSVNPIFVNPIYTVAPFELRSKYQGIAQNGIVLCKPCCPPDYGYGVNSSDFLNSWLDCNFKLRTDIESGTPIFGLLNYARSGTNQASGTAYGWIANVASKTFTLNRWNNAAINTYGTILATHSWNPRSGDLYYIAVDNNYDLVSSYGGSKTWINYSAEAPGGGLIDVDYVDSSASRIPFTNLDRQVGVISLPISAAGDYHSVNLSFPFGETGLCYGPIGHLGSHQLTCVQNIPYYNTL